MTLAYQASLGPKPFYSMDLSGSSQARNPSWEFPGLAPLAWAANTEGAPLGSRSTCSGDQEYWLPVGFLQRKERDT